MRILIVEDEHRIAGNIKLGLEQENYAADVVYDGTEGFDLAASGDYDVIILDIMLPGKSGLDICRDLRREKIHTPILLLTARSQLQDKVSGLDSGADDYLTKPFAFEELLARIRALIRRPRQALSAILKFKDLILEPQNYLVKKSNKPLKLSKKEFAILEYLMRNQGKILTKEQIITHVWDYDADVLPNTVEANIKNLRRKVGENLITTVRGFGYKLG